MINNLFRDKPIDINLKNTNQVIFNGYGLVNQVNSYLFNLLGNNLNFYYSNNIYDSNYIFHNGTEFYITKDCYVNLKFKLSISTQSLPTISKVWLRNNSELNFWYETDYIIPIGLTQGFIYFDKNIFIRNGRLYFELENSIDFLKFNYESFTLISLL